MTVSPELRARVQQRANFACEFCGVSEVNVGGQLTIDHFQPKSKGGDDSLDNLLYSCHRCNLYKQDYWPAEAHELPLWNPRREPATIHFLEIDDGRLLPLTSSGAFTVKRLRLNRAPLIKLRRQKRGAAEAIRLLRQYRDLVRVLGQLNEQFAAVVEQQQQLLEEQRELLRLLLREEEP